MLYNPDKPSSGQLAKGVSLAIRLGTVEKNEISAEQAVFTDMPDLAQFGKLYVTDIDTKFISFDIQLFDSKGNTLGGSSYRVHINEGVDVNSDGLTDIEYKKPIRKRSGFETAIYLSFVSSQETLNTAMFAVLPEQYSRSVYPSGIMGINPQGRFIVRKYEDDNATRSMVYGLQKGDYVLDNISGAYQRVVKSSNARNARAISDDDLSTGIEDTNFLFIEEQFDMYNTPQKLLAALPLHISAYNLDMSISDSLNRLNELLMDEKLIQNLADYQHTSLDFELRDILNSASTLSPFELISLNRFYLSDTFAEFCPPVDVASTDVTVVLPLYSCIIGEDVNDDTNNNEDMRAASFSEYSMQKAAILKKFNTYKKIEIVQNLPFEDLKDFSKLEARLEYNGTNISPNVKLDLGVYGSFNITFSNVDAKLFAGILLQAETVCTLSQNYSANLLPMGPIKLGGIKHPIPCGPVMIFVSCPVEFDIPIEFGGSMTLTSNFFAGFVGLYGGEINVGANYGMQWVKWFKVWRTWIYRPDVYFHPYFNANAVNQTAYYIGPTKLLDPTVINSPLTIDYSAYLSIYPNVKINPTVYIPIAEAGIYGATGIEGRIDMGFSNRSKELSVDGTINFRYELGVSAAFEINLPFNIGFKFIEFSAPLLKDNIQLNKWNLM